jgi:hypothetical protein
VGELGMAGKALSLDEVLDKACTQLLMLLRRTAGNGASVLVLESHIRAGRTVEVLNAVIRQCGGDSIKDQCDKAISHFGIDGSQIYDPVSRKTARGEALRLISLFRRIHRELATADGSP